MKGAIEDAVFVAERYRNQGSTRQYWICSSRDYGRKTYRSIETLRDDKGEEIVQEVLGLEEGERLVIREDGSEEVSSLESEPDPLF